MIVTAELSRPDGGRASIWNSDCATSISFQLSDPFRRVKAQSSRGQNQLVHARTGSNQALIVARCVPDRDRYYVAAINGNWSPWVSSPRSFQPLTAVILTGIQPPLHGCYQPTSHIPLCRRLISGRNAAGAVFPCTIFICTFLWCTFAFPSVRPDVIQQLCQVFHVLVASSAFPPVSHFWHGLGQSPALRTTVCHNLSLHMLTHCARCCESFVAPRAYVAAGHQSMHRVHPVMPMMGHCDMASYCIQVCTKASTEVTDVSCSLILNFVSPLSFPFTVEGGNLFSLRWRHFQAASPVLHSFGQIRPDASVSRPFYVS